MLRLKKKKRKEKKKKKSEGVVLIMNELAGILGCRVSHLPMKYLGLRLGAKFKLTKVWNPIFGKMEKRLVGWEKIYSPKGAVSL